jgi:hypothetical protein
MQAEKKTLPLMTLIALICADKACDNKSHA